MRTTYPIFCAVLVLLLLLLLLAGCGKEHAVAGARVRILTSAVDGAIQGELQFQAVDDGVGRIYAAQALEGDLYVAPGAPSGAYRLLTTAGWGMLWTGRRGASAPLLRGSDYPPAVVRMGRPRALYLASGMPGRWTISTTWAAEWKPGAAGGVKAFRPAKVDIADVGEGIVEVRFPEEVWAFGNVVRLVGLMTDGAVTGMPSYQLLDAARPELPRMVLVLGAVQAPLVVRLVPPPGLAEVPEDVRVQVSLRGVALAHVYEARSHNGTARFEEVAALGHGLRIALPGSGPDVAFDLQPETWRTRGTVHLVALPSTGTVRVAFAEQGGGFVEARVSYRGGKAFGRVPLEHMPAADGAPAMARLRTMSGWQEWWLRTQADTWIHAVLDVDAARPRVELPQASEAACRVRGQVRGAGLGFRVVLRQVLEAFAPAGAPEGEAAVLAARTMEGEGFVAAVSPQGGYEATVPPGRYTLQVVSRAGRAGRPIGPLLFKPGAEVLLDLKAP